MINYMKMFKKQGLKMLSSFPTDRKGEHKTSGKFRRLTADMR